VIHLVPSLLPTLAGGLVTPAEAQEIVVLGSTDEVGSNALREDLMCTGEFVRVDYIDLTARTPSLDELRQYHGVLAFSNLPLVDPTGVGDRLASYVALGGGHVLPARGARGAPTTGSRSTTSRSPTIRGSRSPPPRRRRGCPGGRVTPRCRA